MHKPPDFPATTVVSRSQSNRCSLPWQCTLKMRSPWNNTSSRRHSHKKWDSGLAQRTQQQRQPTLKSWDEEARLFPFCWSMFSAITKQNMLTSVTLPTRKWDRTGRTTTLCAKNKEKQKGFHRETKWQPRTRAIPWRGVRAYLRRFGINITIQSNWHLLKTKLPIKNFKKKHSAVIYKLYLLYM